MFDAVAEGQRVFMGSQSWYIDNDFQLQRWSMTIDLDFPRSAHEPNSCFFVFIRS